MKVLLICLPALQRLGIDTKALLEERPELLVGVDYLSVKAGTAAMRGSTVSRCMIVRLNPLANGGLEMEVPLDDNRPLVNFSRAREELGLFHDMFLLGPVYSEQHDEVKGGVYGVLQKDSDDGFSNEKRLLFSKFAYAHLDVFLKTSLSSPPAIVLPPRTELVCCVKPQLVRL